MPPNVSDGGGARSGMMQYLQRLVDNGHVDVGESSQEYGQSDEFSAVEVSEVSTDAFNQAAARRGKEFLHSQMKQDYYRTLDEFKAAEAELMQRTFEYADAESKVARIKIKLLKILVDMKSFSMDVYANATQTGDPTTTPTRSEARENHREYRQSQNPQPRQQATYCMASDQPLPMNFGQAKGVQDIHFGPELDSANRSLDLPGTSNNANFGFPRGTSLPDGLHTFD